MPPSRILPVCFLWLVTITWLLFAAPLKSTIASTGEPGIRRPEPDASLIKKLKVTAAGARSFNQKKGYNEAVCFLAGISLPSGQEQFFVYDLKNDTLIRAGLVTHGRFNQAWLEGRKYGNTVGGGCTSPGRQKIGYAYRGKFGLAYKLHGLDKSNDKAFERYVVLHAYECVPESAISDEICQSDGCPTVSPAFLQYLKPIIDGSKKTCAAMDLSMKDATAQAVASF